MNRLRFLLSIPLLSNLATIASAADDPDDDEPYDTYLKYLRKQGLKVKECVEHSPSELFGIIREREKLRWGGTTGHEATVVDKFYAKYLETLKPYNDAHFSEVVQSRKELCALFCFVADSFIHGRQRHRCYITHERVEALVEHLITRLGHLESPIRPERLDFSADETAGYLRARLILICDQPVGGPDFDAFRGQLTAKLRPLTRSIYEPIAQQTLYYLLCTFADDYRTPLDPLRGPPEQPWKL